VASNINPYNVDGTFPVANQDNSSQGFRDNFTNIKNNFIFAQNELSDLQSKVVLKSALSGQTLDNDLTGTLLTGPQLNVWTQTYINLGAQFGITTLDFTKGSFQSFTTAGPCEIQIINWPTNPSYASLRIWIVVSESGHTIQFPEAVNIVVNDIAGYNSSTKEITFDIPGDYVFDISSPDNGSNYLLFDHSRNRATFRDTYLYYNAAATDNKHVLLLGYGPLLPLAISAQVDSRDAVSTKGSINSYETILSHLNDVGNGVSGNANIAGFNVHADRSYVNSGISVHRTLGNHDIIGYYNSSATTGDPTGIAGNTTAATFGTMEFWSDSSLPNYITSYDFGTTMGNTASYSAGGNIVIKTKQDYGVLGDTDWPRSDASGFLAPAMSIENDQSVVFYGATASSYDYVNLDNEAYEWYTSPYKSTVILDSTDGLPLASATVYMPPEYALRDGQELTITANCDISSLSIESATAALPVPAYKQATAVGIDGVTATYYFDNSGGLFDTLSIFDASLFGEAGFNGSYTPTTANATSVTINNSTIGTSTGYILLYEDYAADTYISNAPTSAVAGESSKWIYVKNQTRWFRV